MKISETTSRMLSTVTFFATVLVVMCHCDDFTNNKNGVIRFLGGMFTEANVSYFFFLSGFFVARHFGEKGWYRTAIMKRIRTLGIPYVLWCIINLGILCLVLIPQKKLSSISFDLCSIFGFCFLCHPIDLPLWYIKTLFYFILVAPPFFGICKKSRCGGMLIILLFLLLSLTTFGHKAVFGHCFNLIGFSCFLLGAEMVFSAGLFNFFVSKKRIIII